MSSSVPQLSFSHMGIYVTNFALMESFYTRELGFTVTDRGELATPDGTAMLSFLSRDPREHHQIVLVSGRPQRSGFNTINQISFRVDGLPALREMHRRLREAGVAELAPVTHGNALSVYFRDPEGNRLELYIDTPWYVQQPLRQPMDLGLPDDRLWAWVEAEARRLPGFRPLAEWRAELERKMRP